MEPSINDRDFPSSVIEEIDNEIFLNAPLRTISTAIPFKSIRFGKDCIQIYNAIIRKILKSPKMKLGDRIVGAGSTHQILQRQGKAGKLKVFYFLTKKGGRSIGNAGADKLIGSIGTYVADNYSGSGVSIYGVSALDGYHSMLLMYLEKDSHSIFYLIDQGPATSYITGKLVSHSTIELDNALVDYVKGLQTKRTKGGFEYPASIQLFKVYPKEKK